MLESNENPRSGFVSIIIPAFNAAVYLKECMCSVSSQSYSRMEVIIVDDGSTDATYELARRHAEGDARFRVVTQEHAGVSAARNYGVLLSVGEYISFFDADDILYSFSVERRVKALLRAPLIDIVYSDHQVVDKCRRPVRISRSIALGNRPELMLLACPCLGITGVLMRRHVFTKAGLFDTTLAIGEDWDFWIRCSKTGYAFHHLEEVLCEYRQHDTNSTKSIDRGITDCLAMLSRHRPPRSDAPAFAQWIEGRRASMRHWLWSTWHQPITMVQRCVRLMMKCFKTPAMVPVLARVAVSKLCKRIQQKEG
jgi:glycosyltransferase involved in cell wall biosynthesis